MDSIWLESILMGDFNIDLSKASKSWTETFSLFNLSQIIDSPTRVTPSSRTLIDHIYSSTPSHIQEICVPELGVRDNYPVCCTWSKKGVKIPKLGHTLLTYSLLNLMKTDILETLGMLHLPTYTTTLTLMMPKTRGTHLRKWREPNTRLSQNGSLQKYGMPCATETIFFA